MKYKIAQKVYSLNNRNQQKFFKPYRGSYRNQPQISDVDLKHDFKKLGNFASNKRLSGVLNSFSSLDKRIGRRKKWIHPFERYVLRRKNPDQKKYFAFIKKKRTNTFLTITDSRGQVVISQSAGSCKITTKKKKRSPETLKTIASSISKIARSKNIFYIHTLFTTKVWMRPAITLFDRFRQSGLEILKQGIFRCRPHSYGMRKKKSKRL